MNPEIFVLIEKGLSLLPVLVDAGIQITTRVEQLITLNKAAAAGGTISDAELQRIRTDFDTDINAFNADF
jgi:hypothetical protein